ncbi:MAG: type-F conjugative transfer system secretin TraK [Methylococcales bacterium]
MRISIALIVVFMFSFISPAYSAQNYEVSDGDIVRVKISKNDVTRVTVYGTGRISSVRANKRDLTVREDKKAGEIFITPNKSSKMRQLKRNEFSFFVKDSFGSTYTVVAKVFDIPSQTIVLKPKYTVSKATAYSKYKTQPFVKSIKELMKAMATDDRKIPGYSIAELHKNIKLWSETDIKLIRQYENKHLKGEVYVVSNISDKKMELHESEFLGFGDSVLATALSSHTLMNDTSTYLYVVRKGGK